MTEINRSRFAMHIRRLLGQWPRSGQPLDVMHIGGDPECQGIVVTLNNHEKYVVSVEKYVYPPPAASPEAEADALHTPLTENENTSVGRRHTEVLQALDELVQGAKEWARQPYSNETSVDVQRAASVVRTRLEWAARRGLVIRQRAIDKLSDEEREVLGLEEP